MAAHSITLISLPFPILVRCETRRFAYFGGPVISTVCLLARGRIAYCGEFPSMPRDPFIREKFTRERSAARKLAAEYFQRFPKDRYQTEVES
jgi:hypothetical protein